MVKQAINKIEKIEYRNKKVFLILFSIFIFFIISYGFLLNSTMMNAVKRQNLEKEIKSLTTNVNSLEYKYLNIKSNITMDLAKSYGFVAISSNKFAAIDTSGKTLSLSINEN